MLLKIAFGGASTTRLYVMMLNFEAYMIDSKHTMAKHFRIMLAMIHDSKSVGNNLNDDQQFLLSVNHYLVLGKP